MKNMILIFSLIGILAACKENNSTIEEQQPTSIYGTWRHTQSMTDIIILNSPEPGWEQIENGFTLELYPNNTFTSNEFDECLTGRFQIVNDTIAFIYDCEGFTSGFENPPGNFSHKHAFVGAKLQLTHAYFSYLCYTGCTRRFTKIEEPQASD